VSQVPHVRLEDLKRRAGQPEWLAANYPLQAPVRVNWDMTNACNLGCVHCYASSGKAMPGELSDSEALAFAHQLVESQVANVTIAGGEPFIRPVSVPILETLTAGGISTAVVTNGTFVTAELAERLASLGLKRASVSVDAATAGLHDRIRRREGSFAQAVGALRLLRAAGVPTGLNLVITATNVEQVPDVMELAIGLGCESVLLLRFMPVGRGRDHAATLEPGDGAFIELRARFEPHIERWKRHLRISTSEHTLLDAFQLAPDPTGITLHQGCQAGRSLAWVDARGDVYGCVFLPIPFGNVRESSLREIWGRALVRDVRAATVKAGMECGDCAQATRNLVHLFRERPLRPVGKEVSAKGDSTRSRRSHGSPSGG
jgi:AdoMet-dependent heme synthase